VRWQPDPCDGEHTPRRDTDLRCNHPAALERDRTSHAALERGDELVQQLAIAKYALSIGQTERSMRALDLALTLARSALSDLMDAVGPAHAPGTLRRTMAADLPEQRRS
jgi:hypothetical protein